MSTQSYLFPPLAKIKVLGIGGAGGNAVNRMVEAGVHGVEFAALNTDAQVLDLSQAEKTIQLGSAATRGLGAGGDPEVGERAAKESEKLVAELLEGADMVFLAAGMGGGTGSGAAPVIAEAAKRLGILTVAVVTKPFTFEGAKRRKIAEQASLRLAEHVDTLIVVPNDRLLDIVDKRASIGEAFAAADEVLCQGVRGISNIITQPGLINVDFADVRSVMNQAGRAMMGMGKGQGEQRAKIAAQSAAASPLLESSLNGARKLLVNITSGLDFSIGEIYDAMEYLQQFVDPEEAEIFVGHVLDESLNDTVSITILAAGMQQAKRESAFAAVQEVRSEKAETRGEDRRVASIPIGMEEINLDIPSFLRQQKLGN